MSTARTDMSTNPIARWRRLLFSDVYSLRMSIALAVGAAAVAILVRMALEPVLPNDRGFFMTAVAAVLVAATLGGSRAGVLATILLAVVVHFVWLPPARLRMEERERLILFTAFIAIGLMVSALTGRLHRAKRRAEDLAANEGAARLAAQQSEERFRRIFDQGPLGIAIVGLDRRIQDANPMLCHMLGYSLDELKGRTVESLTFPADVDKSISLVQQLNEGRIPNYSMVKRYLRRSGEPFWAILSVTVIRDAKGRPACSLGMVQDISERKRMEQALENAKNEAEAASRAKDQFLAVLSHELRTPLSPVLLAASCMETDTTLPPAVRENLHLIRQNVELEARLIDDLLDLTGIARGKLSLHRTRVDVHAVINQALAMVRQDLRDNRLGAHVHLDAPRSTVDGDPARLQQVFWNLLKNAVKFTPAGGEITIRTRDVTPSPRHSERSEVSNPLERRAAFLTQRSEAASASPGDRAAADALVVEIRDTGVGIPPDVLPRLFRPFEQGAADITQQFGGLGLGLAISRSIVELHGGSISAASDGPNCGAIFTVTLPLTSSPHPPVSPPPHLPPPSARKPGPLHILLVEDHPATRRAMASFLQSLGHDVHSAATLADALALAAADNFDLVISDLALPDGSGHDLMRQLKASGHPPRGVAVSGYGMPDDIRRSRDAGFDEHLTKPVSQEKIREVLSHCGA